MALALVATLAYTAQGQKFKAIMITDAGTITIQLFDGTPKHRDNFVKLSRHHFYDGLLFHRVIPGFMIQGGDPKSKDATAGQMLGEGDLGYQIPAEIKPAYFHQRGALAAARDNNPEKASSACQFYIVTGKKQTEADLQRAEQYSGKKIPEAQKKVYKEVGGTPQLDHNYTVFGQVISGMDAADIIVSTPRNRMDRPNMDMHIKKVKIRKKILGLWL